MFGEMRTAAMLAKGVAGDAAAMDADSVLRMATLGGARAMGLGEVTGSIQAGKRADLAVVDMDAIETVPMYDVVAQLVYATGRHQVSDVWVDGARKLDTGRLVDIDTGTLKAKARDWQRRIAAIRPPR
jgi:5-methylthioadenosine/S-adenosylhomocysteine deaminase